MRLSAGTGFGLDVVLADLFPAVLFGVAAEERTGSPIRSMVAALPRTPVMGSLFEQPQ